MWLPPPPPSATEEEKAAHPRWRRYTRKYRRKRKIVRDVWIVSGLIIAAAPPGAAIVLALGTTFIAFMILDETP
jgi:hypothetical protein